MSRDMQTEARVGDRVTFGSDKVRTIIAEFTANAGASMQPLHYAILGDVDGRLLPSHITGATNLDTEGPIRTYQLKLVPPVVGDRIEAGVIRSRFRAWEEEWATVAPLETGNMPVAEVAARVEWSVVKVDGDTPVLGRWYQ